jgi:hypothetical protein
MHELEELGWIGPQVGFYKPREKNHLTYDPSSNIEINYYEN